MRLRDRGAAQTSASADAGAAFARGKAIVCTRQDEEVPAPDAAGTGTSEPMSITDQWSGSSFSACRFAVNGSFRTCSGQGCCRVAAADGTIRYFRYSDGAFQPREAKSFTGSFEFSGAAVPVKFNYWTEDGALVIDNLDGEGAEHLAYAENYGGETDRVLIRNGTGTDNVLLAALDLKTGRISAVDTGDKPCSDIIPDGSCERFLLGYPGGEWGLMINSKVQDLRALAGIEGSFDARWAPELGDDAVMVTEKLNDNSSFSLYVVDCVTGAKKTLLRDADRYTGAAAAKPAYSVMGAAQCLCCYPDKSASILDFADMTERKLENFSTDKYPGGFSGGFYYSFGADFAGQIGFLNAEKDSLTVLQRHSSSDNAEVSGFIKLGDGAFALEEGGQPSPRYLVVYEFND